MFFVPWKSKFICQECDHTHEGIFCERNQWISVNITTQNNENTNIAMDLWYKEMYQEETMFPWQNSHITFIYCTELMKAKFNSIQ